ncbi:MAG TPA: YkgJ family cysteine cluster protein, partial [Geobacteraceae bacterium]|nr:YkgJ family cysteine cluster protein [Geobacteraceae bacterium]
MNSTVKSYEHLLQIVDDWFSDVISRFPEHVTCADGCSGCCRGLFDITLLDAALLQHGFAQLPETVRVGILHKAKHRLVQLQHIWPELAPPFILNLRPEEEWEELMPDEDE